MSTDLDLRQTPLYREIESFYAALHGPGTGSVTDAADLSVTPDGRRASFTGTVYPGLTQAPLTRIVTVDLETGGLEVQSTPGTSERLPRWSPDGKTQAFLSDRAAPGNFQAWLTHDGADPVPAPAVDGVIESMAWSPDGARLLLGVAGFGADLAGCQGGATTQKRAEDLPAWAPTLDTGDAENLWRHAWMLDLRTLQLRRLGPAHLNVWETCWLGSEQIAAVVSDSHGEGSWYTARVVAIDVNHGGVRDLYRSGDQIGAPAASPAGDTLALIDAVCSDRLVVCGELMLIDVTTAIARRVDTQGAEITHIAWRDASTLIYSALRGLDTVFGELDIRGSEQREWCSTFERTAAGWYPAAVPLPQGGALFVAESFKLPPEIGQIGAAGYRVVRSLATAAACAPGFSKARVEPVTWPARDGLEIQGVLILPEGDGPWPLVMDIHGGPVGACRNRWMGRLRGAKVLADHGIASLYPNPRGSSGRGAAFARLVKGDMGGEDTYDYLRGLDALIERGIADPTRLGVTGISYGGFMSAWLITQDPRFAAAAPISAVADWFSQHRTSQIPYFDALFLDGEPSKPDGLFFKRSPAMYAERVRTPVLQLTGALDRNTPPTQALEFHRSLLEHGVRSILATYPNAGHGIRGFPEVIDATTRYVGWFLEHLR